MHHTIPSTHVNSNHGLLYSRRNDADQCRFMLRTLLSSAVPPSIAFRRLLLREPQYQMRVRYSLMATAVAATASRASAWTILKPSIARSGSQLMSSTVEATPESASDTPALKPEGDLVVQGDIVSFFRGGLLAVRTDENKIVIPQKPVPGAPASKQSSSQNLGGDLIGRQVLFPNGKVGVVVTHRPPIVYVYCSEIEELDSTTEGDVQVLDSFASIGALNNQDSNVFDCFGRPINGSGNTESSETGYRRPIFAPIPQVKDIKLINSPMVTGITMFDALSPIGKGQNMLMLGSDINEMRKYCCDMMALHSDDKDVRCFYAATSDEDAVQKMLENSGIASDVTLVVPQPKDGKKCDPATAAAESTTIAATACAMGEAFALQEPHGHAFVIVDTLDHHKDLWDATTRVLVDVYGVDAVVNSDRNGGASSEMRAFFSSIVQRSAQYKVGGGSVTLLLLATIPSGGDEDDAVFKPEQFENSSEKIKQRIDLLVKRNVPLTAANLRKIEIPIPSISEGQRRLVLQHIDDLISMSDGQIWLDERLANDRSPPMDPQRSITRVGIGADTPSRADAPALRRIVEGLRLDLAQAASMDGADTATSASQAQTLKTKAVLLAMYQEAGGGPRRLSESCAVILAAIRGHLDDAIKTDGVIAGSEAGKKLMAELLTHIRETAADALADVDATQDLSESTMATLEDAIRSYFIKPSA